MAVEALDLVNIKPEESFESYYNERLTFVTNEYSEGRKKEMFNDAYVYILDIEDGIKVNDENIPEIEKEKINSKFSQNELLFIGFMLDMFYDVVMIPLVFKFREIKVKIENGKLNIWIYKTRNVNEELQDILRNAIDIIERVKRFLKIVETIDGKDTQMKVILQKLHDRIINEINEHADVWLSSDSLLETDYVNITDIIYESYYII